MHPAETDLPTYIYTDASMDAFFNSAMIINCKYNRFCLSNLANILVRYYCCQNQQSRNSLHGTKHHDKQLRNVKTLSICKTLKRYPTKTVCEGFQNLNHTETNPMYVFLKRCFVDKFANLGDIKTCKCKVRPRDVTNGDCEMQIITFYSFECILQIFFFLHIFGRRG